MSVLALLDELEDRIDESSSIPFSGKVLIDRESVMELIKEIRLQLPDEIKQAQWIKEERNKILVDAQHESDKIIEDAKNHIENMIQDNEIAKLAKKKAQDIIHESEEQAMDIKHGSIEYADEILNDLEKKLSTVLKTIESNRKELHDMVKND